MNHDWLDPAYCERLTQIMGESHVQQVIDSFQTQKTTSFRVNRIKTSPQEVLETLQDIGIAPEPVSWCEEAFIVPPEQRSLLTHSQLVSDGDIYIQGLSSIFATLVLQPEPDQWNLDMAAAPGGKASHMAVLMENRGKLSVVEPIRPRMYRLADNLKLQGVEIQKTYLMDGRKVGGKVPERFDCIMLDAPCSGDSRIRFDKPKSQAYWSPRKVKEQSRKQKGLILSAFQALKPGGRMLYCTCSFSPEENEAIVDHLLQEEPESRLSPIEVPFSNWTPGMQQWQDQSWDDQVQQCVRVIPNANYDGFFMASIRK